MAGRTIAIGDIHGCFRAFSSLLDAVAPEADDQVIVLGDYVDRGPESREVVDRLLDLQRQCRLVVLTGNHELMLLRGLEDKHERRFWLNFGGGPTLDSYGGRLENIPAKHLAFLRSGRDFYETDTHLFVHANYQPDTPLDQQSETVLMWTHLHLRVPPPHASGKTVIVGHTPQVDGEVLDLGHLICIDTFCCGGGWLTALEVHTREIWQTDRDGRLRGGRSE
ncbi:MAG: serine/threonine protein phosphatase [Pirellulaceae bacterium]|nr:serine/threonine protein phosphatase [Pirellulaceae bacterium]